MATEKGRIIADYAISKLGCAYIYGGYGEKKCTPSFRKERAAQYPDQKDNIYKNCQVLSGKKSSCSGCKWEGKQSYDCAQLTRYSCKAAGQELVSGANSQWNKTAWEAKGEIDTYPNEEGVLLYHRNKSGIMTHTGVGIGNGYAVEARGAKYGVVQTKVTDRTWTHWAVLPGVLNGSKTPVDESKDEIRETIEEDNKTAQKAEQGANTVIVELNTLKNGSKGEQVKTVQRLFNAMGYDCGTVDGIFGTKTKNATISFQQSCELSADGIIGEKTWNALLK